MYDFYTNPPKTKQDIHEYLTSWLEKVDAPPLLIRDEPFIQELGFRRGFYLHGVFRSLVSNEYVWWVTEDFTVNTFPKQRFPTYDALLENVINDYYISWKLNE